jgi:hypothetical protein
MAYTYITDTGVIVPDTSVVLSEVQAEYRAALGQDLNLDPNTPQGQLMTAEVTGRTGLIRNNANLANQLNPNQATGVHLRSIGQLMGINDTPISRSVCLDCQIVGAPNSLFPAGSRAKNANGADFLSMIDILLDAEGKGTVSFQAASAGAIEAPVGTLTPAQPIPGWSSVNNPAAAIVGSDRMTDYEYRVYRQNALANQSQNATRSIYSKLSQLGGIRSLVVRENDEDEIMPVDGVVLEPHSVWVCINDNGGVDSEIATTLMLAKPPGCKLSNSLNSAGTPTVMDVLDEVSGQQYTMRWNRSFPRTVFTRLFVRNNSNMADLVTSVADAVIEYSEGRTNNEAGLVVGAPVSPFTIAGSVMSQLPGLFVRLCEVSTDGITWVPTQIDMALWERAVLPRGNILVTVE